MNVCHIHTSHLLTLKKFNISTNLFYELANTALEKRYNGISLRVDKYKSEILNIKFNKNFVFVKNNKFKITHSREFDILKLISKSKSYQYMKSHHFFFDVIIKNWLFSSKMKNMNKQMYEYVKEVEGVFSDFNRERKRVNKNMIENSIRIYFINNTTFFADEVRDQLELANYLYSDLNLNNNLDENKKLLNKINEYYSLVNNLSNLSFIAKNKITPVKNLHLFTKLPSKMLDEKFTEETKSVTKEREKFILYELFMNKHLNTAYDVELFHKQLKDFTQDVISISLVPRIEKIETFEYIYERKRRQCRLDIKKYFRHKNNNLTIFFDNLVYLVKEYAKFKDICQGFVEHLEKFYLIADQTVQIEQEKELK